MADIKVSELAKDYNVAPTHIIKALDAIGENDYKAKDEIVPPVLKRLTKQLGPKPEKKPEPKLPPKPSVKATPKPKKQETAAPDIDKSAPISKPVPKPSVKSAIPEGAKPAFSASPDAPAPVTSPPLPPEAPESNNTSNADTSAPLSNVPSPASIARAHQQKQEQPRRGNNPYYVQGAPKARRYGQNRPSGGQGGYQGNNNQGGYQNRGGQGGYQGNNNQGGYQNRGGQGGYQNRNQGGYQGNNNQGGYQNRNQGGQGGPKPWGSSSPFGSNFSGGQGGSNAPGNGAPGQRFAPGPGGPGGRPGGFQRPGQKGGAFGKQGTRGKYKRESTRQQEQDILEMPTIHGISVPKGDGTTVVRLKQGASLTNFGEKIGANPANLVMILFKEFSQMITATQSLDEDTLELLAVELGYQIEMVSEEDMDRELLEEFDIDLNAEEADEANLAPRPPVVTVMGHVDHGKTRLLDAIRNTNVIEGEAGGITQRIGAYQIHLEHEGVDRKITFIDTPGHEAFTAMRARGAEITDVAILVVAADDGVMPQTIEAINHAQAANVPIVVAVNKIDKEGANPDKVRGQLTEYDLIPEEYGGHTMFCDISAKQGTGVTELLDSVLLTVDAAMELKANPKMAARGTIIESKLDKGRGPVVSVLVQTGTVKVGDSIVAGRSHGRVRAMSNEMGKKLTEAFPSCPVRIIGLQSVPSAGDGFLVADDERTARQIAERREAAHRQALLAKRKKRMSLEDFKDAVEAGKVDRLNLIIKGDTSGSVEALEDELIKLEEDAALKGEVGLNVIHRGVGDITQNDVNLATVDNAIIIGFNVKTAGMAADLADAEGVDIRFYSIIYKAIEDIELSLHGMLKPEYEESIIGYAEVREIFSSSKAGTIAGSIVKGGEIRRNAAARVFRDEKEIATDVKIDGLKRFKDDATSVKDGFECGISIDGFEDIEVGDIIECYEMVEKPRVLPKR